VEGHIVARTGDVVLIAPRVEVDGGAVVESANGQTVLAAGQGVELVGRGMEGLRFHIQAPEDSAVNLGTLKGDAVGVFAGTLRHSGDIQVKAVTTEGGKVVLQAQTEAQVAGLVRAQRLNQIGGLFKAAANKVMLRSGAIVDVSGERGGGEALVGGGWQGKDASMANAQTTLAEAGARINADATQTGAGGTVVLWSDGHTASAATLSARGGVASGDGGRVETSGKRTLDVTVAPTVNARAAGASAGEWLLDPYSIVIGTGSPTVSSLPGAYGGANLGSDSYVAPALIEAALNAGTSVTIHTSDAAPSPAPTPEGQIRVAEPIRKSAGADTALTLISHGDLIVSPGVEIKSTSGKLDVVLKAGYSLPSSTPSSGGGSVLLNDSASIVTNGGSVTLAGQSQSPYQGVQLSGGVLVDAGSGLVVLNGQSTASSGVSLQHNGTSGVLLRGADVTVDGVGDGGYGVFMQAADIAATGRVSIAGTSGDVSGGYGVKVSGASVIRGVGAGVEILGAASGSGGGVLLQGDATPVVLSGSSVDITGSVANPGVAAGAVQLVRADVLTSSAGGQISVSGNGAVTLVGSQLVSGSSTQMGGLIAVNGKSVCPLSPLMLLTPWVPARQVCIPMAAMWCWMAVCWPTPSRRSAGRPGCCCRVMCRCPPLQMRAIKGEYSSRAPVEKVPDLRDPPEGWWSVRVPPWTVERCSSLEPWASLPKIPARRLAWMAVCWWAVTPRSEGLCNRRRPTQWGCVWTARSNPRVRSLYL
jgi:hypothetical protein